MQYISFKEKNREGNSYVGIKIGEQMIPVGAVAKYEKYQELPLTLGIAAYSWRKWNDLFYKLQDKIKAGDYNEFLIPFNEKYLEPCIERPSSCRDGYAFRQHVAAARRNRGVPMIPEFDEYPIFYMTNHHSIVGPGDLYLMPDHFDKLDFELEIAAVIGNFGDNVKAEHADHYIFGYTVMNDWSARTLQMEEMILNLGPAKGKDFATGLGTVLVTADELEAYVIDPPAGHTGKRHNLKMTAHINGQQVSEGNVGDMDWTFAELIERISYGVKIYPGEVIGSGTVGTGCFLELNGTRKLENPDATPQWIQPGDTVSLTIENIGNLTNVVKKVDTNHSLLALKKPRTES